jgi:molybdenum-dependent DNA-binding transcriptional regulator ModE
LHAAETRFRETYLRLLLAERGSRRRAADEAGVPYRSFCEMLRKLGI